MANPQTQSGLCQLPLELRWAIYDLLSSGSVHITRNREGGLTMIDCVADNISLDMDGRERCITGNELEDKKWFQQMDEPLAMRPLKRVGFSEPLRVRERELPGVIWPRRLLSTWGPHWMCEEHCQAAKSTTMESLMLICKWMRKDIMNYVTENHSVYITDLQVLRDICAPTSITSRIDDSLSDVADRMRHVALTVRLPLPVFQALDGIAESESDSQSDAETKALASLWTDIWPDIGRMQQLRDVRVEIDHTDRSSWSLVNERKVLQPIATLKQKAPEVSITVILPKLHPRYESQDRHFLANDRSSPPFSITRRVRQKCHTHKDIYGHWVVTRSRYDTFPMIVMIMPDLLELDEEGRPLMLPNEYEELKQGELERWKRGEDPTNWLRSTLQEWYLEPPPTLELPPYY